MVKIRHRLSNTKYYLRLWIYRLLGKPIYQECPVHIWFGLSYANYLTVPRSILEAMPHSWKEKFVTLLKELDDTLDWAPTKGTYYVQLRDEKGRYLYDPFLQYRHVDIEDMPYKPGKKIKLSCGLTVKT
jgi:hypothetical protein